MLRIFQSLIVIQIVLAALAGCAKETSEEDREREERERTLERLSRAEGEFSGYLKKEQGIVPLSVTISALRTPTNDVQDPRLRVVVRLGLFGGATISTTNTSFDSGNGLVVANFGDGKAGGSAEKNKAFAFATNGSSGSLEFRGYVGNDTIKDAVLDGANQGTNTLVLERKSDNSLNLLSDANEFTYGIIDSDQKVSGVLTIERSNAKRIPSANSDLPEFPSLDATVVFSGFGVVPQDAKDVKYDPIDSSLEISFSGNSKVVFKNVLIPKTMNLKEEGSKLISGMSGVVDLAGGEYASIKVKRADGLSVTVDKAEVPHDFYIGSYKGDGSPLSFNAIAFLEYLGEASLNDIEFPFPKLPTYRLKLTVCLGSKPYVEKILDLSAIDYLRKGMYFKNVDPNVQEILKLNYQLDWGNLQGRFVASSSHGSGSQSSVKLSRSDLTERSCEIFK